MIKFYKKEEPYKNPNPLREGHFHVGTHLEIMKEENGDFYFHPAYLECYEDFIKYDKSEESYQDPDLSLWIECDEKEAQRILGILNQRKSNIRNSGFY